MTINNETEQISPEVERMLKSITLEELRRVVQEFDEMGEDTTQMKHALEDLEEVEHHLVELERKREEVHA